MRQLLRLIREDWEANFRDWSQPGLRAIAVHRMGVWVDQLGRTPARFLLRRVYRAMYRHVRNHYGIELPVTASIGRRVVIGHQSGIVIHPNATIGDECFLRHNVTIGAVTFDRPEDAPTLGRGVHVSPGAVIIGSITIGDRARIGPNVVIMTDVPADTAVFAVAPRAIRVHDARASHAHVV